MTADGERVTANGERRMENGYGYGEWVTENGDGERRTSAVWIASDG